MLWNRLSSIRLLYSNSINSIQIHSINGRHGRIGQVIFLHWNIMKNFFFSSLRIDCSPSCGIVGSSQTRFRRCLNDQCIGNDIQKRSCSNCSLEMKNNWSCWSDWSDCSPCPSNSIPSTESRSRTCLTSSCEGLSREERSCTCSSSSTSSTENGINRLHVILISFISFLFGCLMTLCIYALCCQRLPDDQNYIPKIDDFNVSHPEITARKLNMYINPREIHSMPPPPAATLKRTSFASSMKTNLDADDL